MEFRWSEIKNKRLKKLRNITFNEILNAKLILDYSHPKIENQRLMLFEYKNYIWVVPYVEEKNYNFLKTIYPSRKLTQKYRRGELL